MRIILEYSTAYIRVSDCVKYFNSVVSNHRAQVVDNMLRGTSGDHAKLLY